MLFDVPRVLIDVLMEYWCEETKSLPVCIQYTLLWFKNNFDLKPGEVAGSCECGNEPSGFVNCGEFLDQLRAC